MQSIPENEFVAQRRTNDTGTNGNTLQTVRGVLFRDDEVVAVARKSHLGRAGIVRAERINGSGRESSRPQMNRNPLADS
jgi:hypothetical protein